MLNISIVVGNPKPRSRTAVVARTVVEKLIRPQRRTVSMVDLSEHASRLFEWPCDELSAIGGKVANSDLLVVASPTYKATYTGLLKAFLDRYPLLGLRGVVAIPVMTGADLSHSMSPEVCLRPLLVELGAIVPTHGLYFVTQHMDRLDEIVDGWAQDARSRLSLHMPSVICATDDQDQEI